jgi:hypothetical protein
MSAKPFVRLIAYLSHMLTRMRGSGEISELPSLDGFVQGYVDETGVLRPLL